MASNFFYNVIGLDIFFIIYSNLEILWLVGVKLSNSVHNLLSCPPRFQDTPAQSPPLYQDQVSETIQNQYAAYGPPLSGRDWPSSGSYNYRLQKLEECEDKQYCSNFDRTEGNSNSDIKN